ncbi:MAG: hypothetical protein JWN16_2171, partial [Alphaproteobacteria bacterium]|nr:hypothetical protein [Alphaproteobacteria bacterium]
MGRSVSLFLVRGASILAAGMLLFAVLGHAHAENLDGYGIKPVAGAPDAADYGLSQASGNPPVSATPAAANNSYNAAPVGGGYNPPAGNGYYPTLASGNAPMPGGYAPAPAGYNAGPPPQAVPASQPVPAYQPAPAYQPPPPVQPQYTAPSYPTRPVQASAGAYGYRSGDGISDAALASGAYPTAYQSAADYVLGTGDKLKLTVFDETDLSGDYTVDSTGFVRLPLIGQVRAAGLTSSQLEGTIGSALAQGYLKSPRVSVAVTTYRPFYIIGAVNRPGEYPYVDHMNALNAIALAGGYTTTAVESVVYVRREGSNEEVEMATDRSTAIHPGDVVRVH